MILFPLRIKPCRSFATRALAFAVGILMTIGPTSRAASSVDDEKAVAALDTEYQAAVKKNDVATMDRILADDFVLVTPMFVLRMAGVTCSARHRPVCPTRLKTSSGAPEHSRDVIGVSLARSLRR